MYIADKTGLYRRDECYRVSGGINNVDICLL